MAKGEVMSRPSRSSGVGVLNAPRSNENVLENALLLLLVAVVLLEVVEEVLWMGECVARSLRCVGGGPAGGGMAPENDSCRATGLWLTRDADRGILRCADPPKAAEDEGVCMAAMLPRVEEVGVGGWCSGGAGEVSAMCWRSREMLWLLLHADSVGLLSSAVLLVFAFACEGAPPPTTCMAGWLTARRRGDAVALAEADVLLLAVLVVLLLA